MRSQLRDLIITNLLAIICGLAVSTLLILAGGVNRADVFIKIMKMLVTDKYNLADILVKATPLIFSALAFAFTYKANLFNIGVQGQFYIGAIVAVSVSLALQRLIPGWCVIFVASIAAALAGGVWASGIGLVKAKYNANEFLTSMMSTYVALNIMNYLLRTVLMEGKGEYPQTDALLKSVWLPNLIKGTRLHVGFLLAVAAAVLIWILLYKTPLGYRIRMVGFNKEAARISGVSAPRLYVAAFFISGALAALAGVTEVNGMQHMLVQNFSPDVGAAGLGIAILANANPIGIIFAAILFGALKVVGTLMSQIGRVPPSIIELMQGFVMIFVIMSYFVRKKLENRRQIRMLQRRDE